MLRTGARLPDAAVASSSQAAHLPPAPLDPGPETLYTTLSECLALEHKFQPRLYLPPNPEHGEVSSGARDGAAHVLRCLKVWYDLPADVLIHAINLFDRFLTKMKVRSCHVTCITVSCMNIAIEEHAAAGKQPRPVSIEDLVSISQSGCTAGDVSRMSRVIVDKLSLTPGAAAVTLLTWLRLFRSLLMLAARDLHLPDQLIHLPESELVNLLEIVSCDAACANARACELALILLYYKLECELVSWSGEVPEEAFRLFDFANYLQTICNMSDTSLLNTRSVALAVLTRYENRAAAPHRQRLVWRLSERTLKVLRPTDRLTSLLPTIQEQHLTVDSVTNRSRSGSESSENEETSDWPRSPLLPVYCDN